MLLRTFLLSLPFLVSADPFLHKRASGVTSDPSTASGQTFDYIIVGAGTTGLTVSSRLSEDSNKTVLLIEAGNDERANPDIYDIHRYGAVFGSALDWQWATDQGKVIRGGQLLGGSSSIGAGHWTRGMKEQYNAISTLVDLEDWSFDALFPYMKKSETFHPPSDEQRAKGANYVADYHGYSGPIQSTFSNEMYGGPQQPAFVDSVRNLTGMALCQDITGGNSNCVAYTETTLNPADDYKRSSAATAYLSPFENSRTNWLTLIGHQVSKILLNGTAPDVVATGVQFKKSDNTSDTFTAYARNEVILAAGAINTPQLLQLSGIGDPAILSPLGIEVKINLTTVGKNLQERTMNSLGHSTVSSFDPKGRGPSDVIAYPSIKELFSEKGGSNGSITADQVAAHITAMIPSWAESQAENALDANALKAIFEAQAGPVIDDNVPVVELFFDTGYPDDIGIDLWQLIPFSRGRVAIISADVFVKPQVTVNYFSIDFDLAIQTAGARLARRILNNAAFSSISTGETIPGNQTVPDDENGGSDDDWRSWIQAPSPNGFTAVHHQIGTVSMMRRELGGAVDGKLLVYDTKNLRVVDASVISLPISGHLQGPVIAFAEKASDIIKSKA